MMPTFPSVFARSKSAAHCTLKNDSGCLCINSSAFAIAATVSSKFPCRPPSVAFTTFTPEPTISLVTPTGSSFEIGNPISASTFPSSTNTLRYNSAATGDTDAGVAVAVGSPDHRVSGLIAVNGTAPPKVFVNCRRRIISRESLPQSTRQAWRGQEFAEFAPPFLGIGAASFLDVTAHHVFPEVVVDHVTSVTLDEFHPLLSASWFHHDIFLQPL